METIVYSTAKTGRWLDGSTWKGGVVPPNDVGILVNPKHTLTLDTNVFTCGIMISKGGTLSFDSKKSITLDNCENIMVEGRLVMKPSSTVNHSIIFHEVDERTFKGADLDINHEDTGLWVMGSGSVDLIGSTKTAWLNLTTSALKGSTSIILNKIPLGFKVGDEISIAPIGINSEFEVRKITKIQGTKVFFVDPLEYDHIQIFDKFSVKYYTAEVLNLTRNVRIEGKGNGEASPVENNRAHIHIMSTSRSTVSNIQIRHMGPRRLELQGTSKIKGRYGLHLHNCLEALRGMIIEGVVIRDCGSHSFVAHATHGVTFRNCITYNTFNCAYWWDLPPDNGTSSINNSNDILYELCISAYTRSDPSNKGYRLASFMLGSGLRNTIRNCIAVGNQGNNGAAGYIWPESSNYTDNLWIFENNIAHNNKNNGIFTWQNDPHNHTINGFLAYCNGNNGIEHGAYTNAYKYNNINLINNTNAIFLHANPRPKGQVDQYGYILSFNNIKSTDPLYITIHTLQGSGPTLFKDCIFSQIIVNELPSRGAFPIGLYDFVNCNLNFTNFVILGMVIGSKIRVQNTDGTCFQIDDQGIFKQIPKFFNN